MGNENSKKAAVSKTAAATTTIPSSNRSVAAALPARTRKLIQNFLLVWFDANLDESKADFKKSLERLRNVVASIITFHDVTECVNFLNEISQENVFIIVSGALGRQVAPEFENMPQVQSIYIFCGNKAFHEEWTSKIPKVKGVFTEIEPICKALQIDGQNCDRAMVSISFKGIDALFMYTQLLKEAILQIEDDDTKSLKELAEYCRDQGGIPEYEIAEMEKEYRSHTPIWWYTAPYFLYGMLNRGLRLMDTEIIIKTGFFIRHLQKHMDTVHEEQQRKKPITVEFTVFRGQGLSHEHFDKMKKSKGGLMAFNNFLSTSLSREVSVDFAQQSNSDLMAVLFVMTIDPGVCKEAGISFVDVKDEGYFGKGEEEILFATHSVFRIQRMNMIKHAERNPMWEVHLTLVGENDREMGELTQHVREEMGSSIGWDRLGWILWKIGQPQKAESLYQMLLEKASSNADRALYLNQLGLVSDNMGEYSKALLSYERSREIYEVALPPNHPQLATSYNNIGVLYDNMGEYSKALSYYEKDLEISKQAPTTNHLHLATSYNNIGRLYMNMGDFSKALSSYEESHEIYKVALPPNHPDMATSYNNIGLVYMNMGNFSKALSYYERSLEIMKVVLPPNHPDLATSYNNIGSVYEDMGEYSKALSYYEKDLEISKQVLPPNHPDLATSYNNIGMVYKNIGEYSKALSSYERSLEIRKVALPPSHPHLASSYNNMGMVYDNIGEYSKALSSYEQSLEIYKVALPPNHPDLANSYNNIGAVYDNMGEYSKALSYYERSLEIKKVTLPPNHPSLATSYNNIGLVYCNMGEYSKALSYFQKAYDIWVQVLPPTHPHIGMVKSSIERVKKMLSK